MAGLRRAYGARRDALLAGLAAALPPGSRHNRPDGGMFVWARLPDGWDADLLLRRALERDVAFVPGAPFFAGPPDRRRCGCRSPRTRPPRSRRGWRACATPGPSSAAAGARRGACASRTRPTMASSSAQARSGWLRTKGRKLQAVMQ